MQVAQGQRSNLYLGLEYNRVYFLLATSRFLLIIVGLSKGAKINGSLCQNSQYRERRAFTLYFPVMDS